MKKFFLSVIILFSVIVSFANPSMEGAISGVFSVSVDKKVYFSQGNLQYQASTNTWRFAEYQWDVIGEANENISSTYSGWIDLFGWGTSGFDGKSPYMTSSNGDNYGNAYYDIAGTNYDWGVYNAISNGGNKANTWRTLTKVEWMYVFDIRTTTSGIRYAKSCVNNVNGVILLPDDWNTNTYSLNYTNSAGADFTSNTITSTQWTTLEEAGAVFLPAAGNRDGTSVNGVGSNGSYWSASHYYSRYVYSVYFSDMFLHPFGDYSRRGVSVRLVRSAQ